MPGVIDTNVLLYAVNASCDEHPAARKFLERSAASSGPYFLTEGIAYEFLRVSTHSRVFPRPLTWRDALAFLSALIDHETFHVLASGQAHFTVLAETLSSLHHVSGNLFFDVRTVVLMREQGVRRIYTTDTDFLQFENIEVVNPLRP